VYTNITLNASLQLFCILFESEYTFTKNIIKIKTIQCYNFLLSTRIHYLNDCQPHYYLRKSCVFSFGKEREGRRFMGKPTCCTESHANIFQLQVIHCQQISRYRRKHKSEWVPGYACNI